MSFRSSSSVKRRFIWLLMVVAALASLRLMPLSGWLAAIMVPAYIALLGPLSGMSINWVRPVGEVAQATSRLVANRISRDFKPCPEGSRYIDGSVSLLFERPLRRAATIQVPARR